MGQLKVLNSVDIEDIARDITWTMRSLNVILNSPSITTGLDLIDPMGGVIYANKWLQAFQREYVNLGGETGEHEEVLEYHERPDSVVVLKSSKAEYHTKKVIFTVGPWINKLFPSIPLHIQREYVNLGGETGEHEEVLEYHERPDSVVVLKSSKAEYHTKKVIFTVGPWINKLFPSIPLHIQPESIAVCYWKAAREQDSALLESDKFPVFIASDDNSKQFEVFGLPPVDYPGNVKICSHHGVPIDGEKHPDVPSQESIDVAATFVKEHVPILDATQPTHVDKCKYTVSEDCHYVIGPYPGSANILIGGCGSGSGFKVLLHLASAKFLLKWQQEKKLSVDVSFFSFDRFLKK
ncbi:hypothetical protein COOONC_13636 [Cooperia oncophora]